MKQYYAEDHYQFSEANGGALTHLLKNPTLGRVWLIMLDDLAVGYMVLAFGYSLEFQGRDAFVDEIFIERAHRGKGIGAHAMKILEDACRELGVHALHLEVERHKPAALGLYRKCGFEDHERYVMTKRIVK
jgi:GNAT superfamily N-acetyltransferase